MRIAFTGLAAVSAFVLLASSAFAQSSGSMSQQGGSMSGPSMQSMGKTVHHMDAANGSTHAMPATVTSVDQKTGMVEASSGSMALKIHFPPASLANVKAGDKITLELSFSKP